MQITSGQIKQSYITMKHHSQYKNQLWTDSTSEIYKIRFLIHVKNSRNYTRYIYSKEKKIGWLEDLKTKTKKKHSNEAVSQDLKVKIFKTD